MPTFNIMHVKTCCCAYKIQKCLELHFQMYFYLLSNLFDTTESGLTEKGLTKTHIIRIHLHNI